MKLRMIEQLLEARRRKLPVAVLTALSTGRQTLYRPQATAPESDVPPAVVAAADRALGEDRARTVECDGERYFIQIHNPPIRLFIQVLSDVVEHLRYSLRPTGDTNAQGAPRQGFVGAGGIVFTSPGHP